MKELNLIFFGCLFMALIGPLASNKRTIDPATLRSSDSTGHYIGENYGGGIVFYVFNNGQHGLVAAVADQNRGIPWYNGMTRFAGADGDGQGAGAKNTQIILQKLAADDPKGIYAAKVCVDYKANLGAATNGGWYLPSKSELHLLFLQKLKIGGFANTSYWSSTEYKFNSVWIESFRDGRQLVSNSESYANAVRAIRSF